MKKYILILFILILSTYIHAQVTTSRDNTKVFKTVYNANKLEVQSSTTSETTNRIAQDVLIGQATGYEETNRINQDVLIGQATGQNEVKIAEIQASTGQPTGEVTVSTVTQKTTSGVYVPTFRGAKAFIDNVNNTEYMRVNANVRDYNNNDQNYCLYGSSGIYTRWYFDGANKYEQYIICFDPTTGYVIFGGGIQTARLTISANNMRWDIAGNSDVLITNGQYLTWAGSTGLNSLNSVSIGGSGLKSTNLSIQQEDANTWQVRDNGDTVYKDWKANNLILADSGLGMIDLAISSGTLLPLAGGTMSGAINMGGNNIEDSGKGAFTSIISTGDIVIISGNIFLAGSKITGNGSQFEFRPDGSNVPVSTMTTILFNTPLGWVLENGATYYAYSGGNDKYIAIDHNDTSGIIEVSTGSLVLRPASGQGVTISRGGADSFLTIYGDDGTSSLFFKHDSNNADIRTHGDMYTRIQNDKLYISSLTAINGQIRLSLGELYASATVYAKVINASQIIGHSQPNFPSGATFGVGKGTITSGGRADFEGDVHCDAVYDSGGQVTGGNSNRHIQKVASAWFMVGSSNNATTPLIEYEVASSTQGWFYIKNPNQNELNNYVYTQFLVDPEWNDNDWDFVLSVVSTGTASGICKYELGLTTSSIKVDNWTTYNITPFTAPTLAWENTVVKSTCTLDNLPFVDGDNVVARLRRKIGTCLQDIYPKSGLFNYTVD